MNDIELIKSLAEKGLRPAAIAKEINRDTVFVNKYYRRLGFISERTKLITKQLELEKQGQRFCTTCQTIKPFTPENFYKRKSVCNKCTANLHAANYFLRCEEASLDFVLNKKLIRCRERKNKNISCSISLDDLRNQWQKQKGLCFYTGRPMSLKVNDNNGLSIDRLNSDKDYIVDNIVLCCKAINYMKLDMSLSEFRDWCKAVANF